MKHNMFTGIVEEIGRIHHISKAGRAEKLVISCHRVLEGTKIGDSIAVNGTCLTVTAMDSRSFTADVTPETMRRTAFSLFRPDTPVNLERALRLSDRLGGHIMMGHVDGTGRILSMEKDDNAVNISISIDRKWMRYIIEKDPLRWTASASLWQKGQISPFPLPLFPIRAVRRPSFGSTRGTW